MSFLTTLTKNCTTYADKTAIQYLHSDGTVEMVTYHQLENRVVGAMAYLESLGVQRGDRVALQLPKCLDFIYLHLGIMQMGAVSLPLNPAYPQQELAYFLSDSETAVFFADIHAQSKIDPILSELPHLQHCIYLGDGTQGLKINEQNETLTTRHSPLVTSSATTLMIYTSGTTGRPKGAQITVGNLTANLNSLHEAWGWQDDDVLLHVLPIFHVHGLVVALHGALNAGATAVLIEKFDANDILARLASGNYTVFMAVPTIHRRLYAACTAPTDLSHMRLMTSGSDRLPDDLFTGYQTTFNYTLLERYGMTETGMNLSNPLHGERRVGSVGLPLPGVEARIVNPEDNSLLPDGEIGEVQIRGTHVCKGYWQQPQKTAEAFTPDGWLCTGDLGLREADGYYTLKGRAKDLIITGGLNVYPPEVELVLADHPAVAASAVVGCLDDEWGEMITAVIVQKTACTTDDIIAYCREKLAHYKAPRRVIFVDELPRNALGKVQKAQLRRELCAG